MGARGPGSKGGKGKKNPSKIKKTSHPWNTRGLSRIEKLIIFLETLPVTKGTFAGQKMKIAPWQRDIIDAIYRTNAYEKRIVRTALISIPRKNGKTGLAAGLCLAHLLGPEAEPRGECYSAASDREQASIIFNEMEAIIQQTPWMEARCNIRKFHKIIEDVGEGGTGSSYRALSADGRKAHGLNVSFYVYDELAMARDRHLLDGLQTATGGRSEPLGIIISTQSADHLHPMSQLVDYGLQVNQGIIEDEAFHATIYSAPEDSDPWAEETWVACNPALGTFRSLEEMRLSARSAQRIPAEESRFRNLYLNQRVDAEERFINASEWNACSSPIDLASLAGKPCFGGLDLGGVRDLTALVLVFPDSNGFFDIVPFFWCAGDNIAAREDVDKVPYRTWAKEGFITPTPGKIIDYDFVSHRLGELSSKYNIKAVAFDRWRIDELKLEMAKRGVETNLVEFGQGFQSMSPAITHLENAVIDRRLRHGGNPILRWCASNAIIDRDPAGNKKLNKKKSREMIDGLVALSMAIGLAKRHEEQASGGMLLSMDDLPLFSKN